MYLSQRLARSGRDARSALPPWLRGNDKSHFDLLVWNLYFFARWIRTRGVIFRQRSCLLAFWRQEFMIWDTQVMWNKFFDFWCRTAQVNVNVLISLGRGILQELRICILWSKSIRLRCGTITRGSWRSTLGRWPTHFLLWRSTILWSTCPILVVTVGFVPYPICWARSWFWIFVLDRSAESDSWASVADRHDATLRTDERVSNFFDLVGGWEILLT